MAIFPFLAAALGLLLSTTVAAQGCPPPLEPSAQLKIRDGYAAQVILNELKSPRDIVFDTAGNLLVAEQAGGGIRRVVLSEDESGDSVCVVSSAQLIDDADVSAYTAAGLKDTYARDVIRCLR